jgi:hypothetical protein
MSSVQRVLVVANRTADSPDLIAALRRRPAATSTSYTLLVPAVPHGLSWAADMKSGWPEAISRAELGAERMRLAGIDLERTIVGDPDPFAAVGDVLHGGGYDEVIVSTLPRGVSRWLRVSLPGRLRRATDLRVTQITAHPLPARPPARERELAGTRS